MIKSLLDRLWNAVDVIMAALMAMMIVLVFANVVLRYGFSSGLRPSVELSRLGFVWIVMIGAVTVLRRGEHLAITEFAEALFPKLFPYLKRLSSIVIMLSVAMLFWGASKQTLANWNNISQLTGLPKGLLYLPGAISGALMFFVAFYQFFYPVKDRGSK